MGVYQIRNLNNGKIFVGSSTDIDKLLPLIFFELLAKIHPSKSLVEDWYEADFENFKLEILEEIPPSANLDFKSHLAFLEDLWLEKLQPFGERDYNDRQTILQERFQIIAENLTSAYIKYGK